MIGIAVFSTAFFAANPGMDYDFLNVKKGKSYEKMWAKVDSLDKQGLPQSALEVVNEILNKAQTEKNYGQEIKGWIYTVRYSSQLEESGYEKTIKNLEEKILKTPAPSQQILHSILGEMYKMYYNQNRYQILTRTYSEDLLTEDIAAWDARTMMNRIIFHYTSSLANHDSLQKIRIDIFSDVLSENKEFRYLRPTVYDFLAHRALDFFSNSESGLSQPADQYVPNDPLLFSEAAIFSKLKVETKDTLSLKYFTITTFQKLLSFHLPYNNPAILIDADIKRLQYVRNNSPLEEKDSLYLLALTQLKGRYSSDSASAEVSYQIASFYQQQASLYNPEQGLKYKWYFKNAVTECEYVISKFPKTYAARNCAALVKQINDKSFSVNCEKYSMPDKSSLINISYRNVPQIYYKIVKSNHKSFFEKSRNTVYKELLSYILSLPEIKNGNLQLTLDGDFQNHSAEAMLPVLPVGEYIVIFSYDPAFKSENNIAAYYQFSKTELSYYYQQSSESEYIYRVTNRETGKPESGVTAEMWKEEYNYSKQEYIFTKLQSFVTDANGTFAIPSAQSYRYFRVHLMKGNDRLFSDDYLYQYQPYKSPERTVTHTYFFTDRSIYRPGQTVYFKGIVVESTGNIHKIKPAFKTTVTLFDVNYQKVSDISLTTNEYGSFDGSFTIPTEGLAGNMMISDSHGSVYISVEEYKRPMFEAEFEPVKESYKLNSKVSVKGKAMSYSGAPLDGATVTYRITRQAWYPYRYYWGWYPSLPGESVVDYGTMQTADDGTFTISFDAKPDPSIKSTYKPAFWFVIQADVTDINGETHSTSHTVSVGYESYYLGTNLDNETNLKTAEPLKITGSNLSGQQVEVSGTFQIFQVETPDNYTIDRIWTKPEFTLFTMSDYKKEFPFYPFDKEQDITLWPKTKKVMSFPFKSIPGDTTITGTELKLTPGYYYLEVVGKDKNGEEVKYQQYFQVFEPVSGQASSLDAFKVTPVKKYCEPGEKAQFLLTAKAKDVTVLFQIEHKNKIVKSEWITMSNEQKLIEIPVEEMHRGNFSVHFNVVKHAKLFSFNETVIVPFTNKQLEIKFETFRNKLYPGEDEEWRLIIKDKDGAKVAAEMMATLYDASLDAFKSHYWYFWLYGSEYSRFYTYSGKSFSQIGSSLILNDLNESLPYYSRSYDALNWFGFNMYYGYYGNRYRGSKNDGVVFAAMAQGETTLADEEDMPVEKASPVTSRNGDGKTPGKDRADGDKLAEISEVEQQGGEGRDNSGAKKEVQIRTNLNETAFFYPKLQTNEKGEIVISFKIPEALTKWKMLGVAHTKDLQIGTITNELITQKDLMIVPNLPRFFRENDKIQVNAKIQNVSGVKQVGNAKLEIFDAVTMKSVDALFGNTNSSIAFQSEAGKSVNVSWDLLVPEGIQAVTVRMSAITDKFSDGEEKAFPILTNRMLVTETLPLPMKNKGKKTYTFEKLVNAGSSSTLKHHKYTLEYTSNPAWYAIQALPYMMEYPYECSEQVFSRYYANTIATSIANSAPKIKRVFEMWQKTPGSKALLSNLEKNQELKSLLLEETPWVLDAQDESERKRRVALLFDLNHMSSQQASAVRKLEKLQTPNGGWAWFPGGRDDRYITQHIVTGFGHLYKLGMIDLKANNKVKNMVFPALKYLDREIVKDYESLKKYYKKEELEKDHLSYYAIHYLYARTFFTSDYPIDNKTKEAWNYFYGQAQKYWLRNHLYSEGMIALALFRSGDKVTSQKIIKSLKERSIVNEELGMYWKENSSGYYWWQAPIETHSLLTEAFNDIEGDVNTVNELRTWLLKQKQVQDWKTTKATAEAVYALLLRGTDWLATESSVVIHLGSLKVDPKTMPDIKEEAGTGYFKTSWDAKEIKPEMGNITVEKSSEGVSWGAVYWQYFEQLDKITPHETPLKINKKLFIETMTDRGKTIVAFKEGNPFKVGDKIIVRIELRVDRDMEYVHMKDMRASGFEPINVISSYKWQDGLGYYESTRDVATNFFFSYLPKGTYVFEYPLRASLAGNFSNGITTIQCMYAPEFTSHSEGIRVKIESK
jgi:uncharacterized protein YfaS (alpha-2-macroglobulin family)